MIIADTFAGRNVALFGLGGSGQVTAKALVQGRANITAWDDNPDQVEKSAQLGIPTGDLRELDWRTIDSFILAPGVPLTHPRPHWSVELAQNSGTEIIGDIEIFVRERAQKAPDCPFIAVTGTNGKSTTTALISHILEHAGYDVQMGGNIGTAILLLDAPSPDRIYVVECSSYQIDLAPSINPTAGILLNLSPDHLDRHGDMDHYAAVKERLVAHSQTAIVGIDDPWCQAISEKLMKTDIQCVPVSVETSLQDGLFLDETLIIQSDGLDNQVVANVDNIPTLRGKHNAQNAAAAIAACLSVGMSADHIDEALMTFPGLKHRMQPVAQAHDIVFVNDSKATNAEAAAPALASYEDIFWIVGGRPKDGGIKPLSHLYTRVAKAFLIGEAAPSFAAELSDQVEFEIAHRIDLAIDHAFEQAIAYKNNTGKSPTILLSPACASFDQFSNFEIRGDAFVDHVAKIEGIEMLIPYTAKGLNNG